MIQTAIAILAIVWIILKEVYSRSKKEFLFHQQGSS